MNTLLFPAFTPPLDTPTGYERMNVQLVKVKALDEGYAFDFSLAERFVRIAKGASIRTIEHTHLFSQWGAAYAITIYGEKDEKEVCLFNHSTPADSKEYVAFLDAYLSAFREFTKKMGIENDILYHISDEPVLENIDGYRRAKALMRSIFPNGKFADALDDYEFFKEGLVEMPIVDVRSVQNYEGRCDSFMLYYTGGSLIPNVINRLLPSAPQKTRAFGYVLFGYNAKGFLHWAYNNYYGRLSNGIPPPLRIPASTKTTPA